MISAGTPSVPGVRVGVLLKMLSLAGRGRGTAEIVLKLLVDVAERARKFHSGIDRETQTVGLSESGIRVLTEDHDLYVVERTGVKGREYLSGRRKDLTRGIAGADKVGELSEIVLVPFGSEGCFP